MYFIHLEKRNDLYVQVKDIDFIEHEVYSIENYSPIIKKNFDEIKAIVQLKSGKFKTNVYIPKDKSLSIYFCLVNSKNLPQHTEEIKVEKELISHFINALLKEVSVSEGILPENKIDVAKEFISLKYSFNSSSKSQFYNFLDFEDDSIIIGPPGCGKTTIMQMVTIEYLRNFWFDSEQINKIPIFIKLRNYNDLNISLDSFLDNSISNKLSKYKFLRTVRNSGKLLLLLDGADEIDYEKFKTFGKTIAEYKKKNPFTTFIISSRPDKRFDKLMSFNKCHIKPLEDNQIEEFVFKRIDNQIQWKNFTTILDSVPEVKDVLRNPLLLSIAIYLFETQSILPLNTGQILKELVDVQIKSWDSHRNIDRRLNQKSVNPNDIIKVLGKLSLILTEKKCNSIQIDYLESYYPSFKSIEELKEFLKYVEFATSLILVKNESVSFTHKSLQDYFCSNYLVESVDGLKKEIIVNKDWNKILKMISGISSDPNYLINKIMEDDEIDEFEKAKKSISFFSESNNLSPSDLKKSFEVLENYLINYNSKSKISESTSKNSTLQILFDTSEETTGLYELIKLIKVIFDLRHTKYEYDFHGYLSKSNSLILKSFKNLHKENSKIIFKISGNKIILEQEKDDE